MVIESRQQRRRPGDSLGLPIDIERFGAVAIIDALGFQGIWKRENPARVIRAMSRFRASMQSIAAGFAATQLGASRPEMRVTVVSDTVAISAVGPNSREVRERGKLYVQTVATLVASTRMVGSSDVPLLFRGAIAAGTLYVGDEDLLGQPVDEAAKHTEDAEGAFVRLLPSASETPGDTDSGNLLFDSYPVPLHDNVIENAVVVNPFWGLNVELWPSKRDELLSWFDRPTGISKSVARKKQNTATFLNALIAGSRG